MTLYIIEISTHGNGDSAANVSSFARSMIALRSGSYLTLHIISYFFFHFESLLALSMALDITMAKITKNGF